jgi:hypothetical protein
MRAHQNPGTVYEAKDMFIKVRRENYMSNTGELLALYLSLLCIPVQFARNMVPKINIILSRVEIGEYCKIVIGILNKLMLNIDCHSY